MHMHTMRTVTENIFLGRTAVLCRCSLLLQIERSAGLPVTIVRPVKTTEEIKMPFGLLSGLGPGNHVLITWGSRSPMQGNNFEGESGDPL